MSEPVIDRLSVFCLQVGVQPGHPVGVGFDDDPSCREAGVGAFLERHRVHPLEDLAGDREELGGGEVLGRGQHLRFEGGQDLFGYPVGEIEHLRRVPPGDAALGQSLVEAGELVGETGGIEDHHPAGGRRDPQGTSGFGGHAAASEFLVLPGRPVRLRVGVVTAGLDRVTAEARDDAPVVAESV